MEVEHETPVKWQDDPPAFKRNMDPSACRNRFRAALLGPC